ncbi:MAG: hypothetical protein JNM93_02835 [Bacteriovoracaceae bacterium]|nr:hypothetical protein [Bacteriovoracaceae bacterium]
MKKILFLVVLISVTNTFAQTNRPKTKLEATQKLMIKGGSKISQAEYAVGVATYVTDQVVLTTKKKDIIHTPLNKNTQQVLVELENSLKDMDPQIRAKIIENEKSILSKTLNVDIARKSALLKPELSEKFSKVIADEYLRNPKELRDKFIELTNKPSSKRISYRGLSVLGVVLVLDAVRRDLYELFGSGYTYEEYQKDLDFIDSSNRLPAKEEVKSEKPKITNKAFGY